jgi:flagellar hook-associated protein 2
MTSFAVDGIVSGLDTTALITALMQAEAMPQAALQTKVTDTNTVISAYQSVNARFAALQTSAEALSKATTWSAVAASSSDPSVGVTADANASVGSLSFRVLSTAAGQISVSKAVPLNVATSFDVASFPIEIRDAAGVTVGSVTPASGSLADVVSAINVAAATTGVKAVAVQVAPGSYRLQLSSATVGSTSAFSVNDSFALSAGIGAPLQDATDAVVHIGPAGAGYDVTSNTNTFTGALPGVTFTVSKKDTDVTLSMANNPNALADQMQAMVDATNAALTEIGKQTGYDATAKKGGVLLTDSGVRELKTATLMGVTQAVALLGPPPTSVSPVSVGIQTDRFGTMTFDRAKFLALQAADPAQAQAVVQGVAGRLAAVAKGATDKTTGTLTLAVQGRNALVTDLSTRITDWDGRLALRKAALQSQFSAMEVALSGMKSQSSWLSSQLNAMPATYAG